MADCVPVEREAIDAKHGYRPCRADGMRIERTDDTVHDCGRSGARRCRGGRYGRQGSSTASRRRLAVAEGIGRAAEGTSSFRRGTEPAARNRSVRSGASHRRRIADVCRRRTVISLPMITLRVKLNVPETNPPSGAHRAFERVSEIHSDQAIFQINRTGYLDRRDWGFRVTYRSQGTFVRSTSLEEIERAMAAVAPNTFERRVG